jgi:hypothetical protein
MTLFLSTLTKMLWVFLYLLVVAYSEWIVDKILPDGKVKDFFLRQR